MYLIVLTDSFPEPSSAGISQTLYNLLQGYLGKVVVMVCTNEVLPCETQRLTGEIAFYKSTPFRPWHNRIGKYVNPLFERINLFWQQQMYLRQTGLMPTAESLVLVSTTVPHKLHKAWCLMKAGYTVVPYFMDDWLAGNTLRWKGGNIQQVAKDILANAPAWLMISENLKQVLMQRYGLQEKPTLIVHNPAPEIIDDSIHPDSYRETDDGIKMTDDSSEIKDEGSESGSQNSVISSEILSPDNYRDVIPISIGSQPSTSEIHPGNYHPQNRIVYAGSIWPMHADALIATAQTIHLLQQQGHTDYTLQVYAPQAQWARYAKQLSGAGVSYAGWLPANSVQALLPQAWLLLCTASFLPQYAAFSFSSVQTKLTTYLAAGRPILYVGPPDGASGDFVVSHGCGYTATSATPGHIASCLLAAAADTAGYRQKAKQALALAQGPFAQAQVQQKLYQFLQAAFDSTTARAAGHGQQHAG